ncbi:MAG: PAS domain S-box protein, partial [Acidobacteria bacterium]|nr:PAS domain S-box protein [Acidobacteriota bacterium]
MDLFEYVSTLAVLALTFGVVILIVLSRRAAGRIQRAERLIRASEERYRRLFEETPVGYVEIGGDGTITHVNAKECELRGVVQDWLEGRFWWDLEPVEGRERARETLRRKLHDEVDLVPYQRRYRRPDGEVVTVEIHESFIRDGSGEVVGIRCASLDITERARTEATAYQTTSELKAIFSAFPDVFYRIDAQGMILDFQSGGFAGQKSPPAHKGKKL